MKRLFALVLALFMSLALSACQRPTKGQSETSAPPVQTQAPEETTNGAEIEPSTAEESVETPVEANSILIAYFTLGRNAAYPDDVDASTSASLVLDGDELIGTTEYVARLIQEKVGGELHAIEVADPYSTDFDTVVDQNHDEMNAGTLPELKESNLDISQYDTVFIGYPVWATNAPQAVFSFLSQYNLAEKTVVPFCTHDGYGAGSSYRDIAEAISGEAQTLEGLAIQAPDAPGCADVVSNWLSQIGMEVENEIAITITVDGTVLEGVLYSTALADEIRGYFPLTVSMVGYGGREYYGGVDFYPAEENLVGGGNTFENGDITYCEAHHNMAIFYAQTDHPTLSVDVIPIGRVTSDLSIFEELPGSVSITFALAE